MQWDFQHTHFIPKQAFVATYLGCGKEKKYRKMLSKAQSAMTKELDLVKFIHR